MDITSDDLRITIAGAGLAGLTLAQHLRPTPHIVNVFERHANATSGHGYRVSLKRAGIDALRSALPTDLFELVVATRIRQATRMIFMEPDLQPKFQKPIPLLDVEESFGVNRRTLREILTTGIDVRYGKAVTGFEHAGDELTVTADGRNVAADLLVGADGTDSAVRAQLIPDSRIDEIGWAIWGRTPLTSEIVAELPVELDETFNRIIHPSGAAMSVVTCRAHERPTVAARRLGTVAEVTDVEDYLSWMVTPTGPLPERATATGLAELAAETVRSWHPSLEQIIAAAPQDAFAVRIRSAAPVEPWAAEGVTLLGDAVHTMSPGRGDGANVALRDAALLGDLLSRARDRESLRRATREYEVQMLEYGFQAVAASRDEPFAFFARPGTAAPGVS